MLAARQLGDLDQQPFAPSRSSRFPEAESAKAEGEDTDNEVFAE